jgi:hypothetical protein
VGPTGQTVLRVDGLSGRQSKRAVQDLFLRGQAETGRLVAKTLVGWARDELSREARNRPSQFSFCFLFLFFYFANLSSNLFQNSNTDCMQQAKNLNMNLICIFLYLFKQLLVNMHPIHTNYLF